LLFPGEIFATATPPFYLNLLPQARYLSAQKLQVDSTKFRADVATFDNIYMLMLPDIHTNQTLPYCYMRNFTLYRHYAYCGAKPNALRLHRVCFIIGMQCTEMSTQSLQIDFSIKLSHLLILMFMLPLHQSCLRTASNFSAL
jgi:hypothetical protein